MPKLLSDKIANILCTTPGAELVDDDNLDQNIFKSGQDSNPDVQSDIDEELSTLRTKNADLLSDVNERYRGKKLRRESLESFETGGSGSSDEGSQGEVSDDHDEEKFDINNDEDEVVSENEDENSDAEKSKLTTSEDDQGETLGYSSELKNFKALRVNDNIEKGIAVKNQLIKYEKLTEMRIILQKALLAANKMPQTDYYNEIKNSCGKAFTEKVNETINTVSSSLNKLIVLQQLVWKKYPQTKSLSRKYKTDMQSEDIEDEIISSEDEDGESEDDEFVNINPNKRRKLENYEEIISDQFNSYNKRYRNNVIKKWHEKTSIGELSGLKSKPHSITEQIDYILMSKEKLVKRTQCKRSNYDILKKNKVDLEDQNENDDESEKQKQYEEYDSNIFDDDDFYHQLLRELIEAKSADVTDPIQISKQWAGFNRSKLKRKIDTRATKGRKIKYIVHQKLVCNMPQLDEEPSAELPMTLFGKKCLINSQ